MRKGQGERRPLDRGKLAAVDWYKDEVSVAGSARMAAALESKAIEERLRSS
jgi:hypothetical protein